MDVRAEVVMVSALLCITYDYLFSFASKNCPVDATSFTLPLNPLTLRAGIFPVSGLKLSEDRVLHKGAWVAKLLGTIRFRPIKRSNLHVQY